MSKKKTNSDKKKSVLSILLAIALAVMLLLLLKYVKCGGADEDPVGTPPVVDTVGMGNEDSLARALEDSLARARADSLVRADSLAKFIADSLAKADSLARIKRAPVDSLARGRADSLARARADSLVKADSLARSRADSLAGVAADSLARADSLVRAGIRADSIARARADSIAGIVDPCARDTLAPWVSADPSGGLHRKAVSVKLVANKECRVEWSFDGVKNWNVYDPAKPIGINKAVTLYYRATDNCGRKMDVRSKRYEFDFVDNSAKCPADMELVRSGGREYCVDAYQWPNKKGVLPASFVSLYQAMDSCFSQRKRLCSSEEWTAACAGPEGWKYLYGESYEGNACVTRDTAARRSGSRPECRGYYAVFDMSGNLGEWTSTPAPQDRSFNNVMGGFWASGSQSRCADARYSYFPQNRHNPVGFRCCRDTGPSGGESSSPRQKGGGR